MSQEVHLMLISRAINHEALQEHRLWQQRHLPEVIFVTTACCDNYLVNIGRLPTRNKLSHELKFT